MEGNSQCVWLKYEVCAVGLIIVKEWKHYHGQTYFQGLHTDNKVTEKVWIQDQRIHRTLGEEQQQGK